MPPVSIVSENIVSPLGFTSEENFQNLSANVSGVKTIRDSSLLPVPFSGAQIDPGKLEENFRRLNNQALYTRLEKIMLLSVSDAISRSGIDMRDPRTVLFISTTKGNIELLSDKTGSEFDRDRIQIWKLAEVVTSHFQNPNKPIVLSNACISGVAAILAAKSCLDSGKYRHAVVCGADALTRFVVSGFQSFLALSEEPCKPFDKNRKGISLGEAASTVVLSIEEKYFRKDSISITGGRTSNDANHISGPSRTGEGLVQAIENTFRETGVAPTDIQFISAHGTATPYNDEMESIAFSRTGLEQVPLNSFKGYYGHTLGAAGVLETVATIHSMKNNLLIRSAGYSEHGVTKPVNVLKENMEKQVKRALKVASGFGGCNAAMILEKND